MSPFPDLSKRLVLRTETYGETGPKLLIAHGLFGSARNWGAIGKRMGRSRRVTVPDMRNHGASPRANTQSYADMASDLTPLAGGDVLGHSMGGKAAMALALTQPDHVNRLVVADIAPVTYGHTQRPLIEAMRQIDLRAVETRSQADTQLAAFVDDVSIRAFLLQSLDIKSKSWMLNLDVLDREMDQIIGWEEIDAVFEGPALFLTGGASHYVQSEHRDKIRELFPAAKFASIPRAGHWLHAERPQEFIAAVEAFLNLDP